MSTNVTVLNGKLPHFDSNYKAGEGDKASFMSWAISVQRNFKPADAQYYPEDLIPFKVWGKTADFINNNFAKGDAINLVGRLQKDDDYEDTTTGEKKRGQLYLLVNEVSFSMGGKSTDKESTTSTTPKKGAPATGKVPGKKPPIGRPAAKKGNRPF